MCRDDKQGDHKIAARHNRDDHIKGADRSVLSHNDHRRDHDEDYRRHERRNSEGILKRRRHRVADDLADSAPADQTRQRKQDRDHGTFQFLLSHPLRIAVDIVSRTTVVTAVERVLFLIKLR